MEDFVTGIHYDYNKLFAWYPKDETTPSFPETNIRKDEGDTVLDKEYHLLFGKLLYFCEKEDPVGFNAV